MERWGRKKKSGGYLTRKWERYIRQTSNRLYFLSLKGVRWGRQRKGLGRSGKR